MSRHLVLAVHIGLGSSKGSHLGICLIHADAGAAGELVEGAHAWRTLGRRFSRHPQAASKRRPGVRLRRSQHRHEGRRRLNLARAASRAAALAQSSESGAAAAASTSKRSSKGSPGHRRARAAAQPPGSTCVARVGFALDKRHGTTWEAADHLRIQRRRPGRARLAERKVVLGAMSATANVPGGAKRTNAARVRGACWLW